MSVSPHAWKRVANATLVCFTPDETDSSELADGYYETTNIFLSLIRNQILITDSTSYKKELILEKKFDTNDLLEVFSPAVFVHVFLQIILNAVTSPQFCSLEGGGRGGGGHPLAVHFLHDASPMVAKQIT